MAHQLAGFLAGRRKANAVHHVVQAAFQNLQQVFAGDAGFALGHVVVLGKLAFQHAVVASGALLGPQLHAVLRDFSLAGFAMLAGDGGAAGDGALAGIAAVTL